jgi:hypothetical protein
LSERRHRLYSPEIPEVVEGLRLRLEELLEKREDSERAEVAFRTLYRLRARRSRKFKSNPRTYPRVAEIRDTI